MLSESVTVPISSVYKLEHMNPEYLGKLAGELLQSCPVTSRYRAAVYCTWSHQSSFSYGIGGGFKLENAEKDGIKFVMEIINTFLWMLLLYNFHNLNCLILKDLYAKKKSSSFDNVRICKIKPILIPQCVSVCDLKLQPEAGFCLGTKWMKIVGKRSEWNEVAYILKMLHFMLYILKTVP